VGGRYPEAVQKLLRPVIPAKESVEKAREKDEIASSSRFKAAGLLAMTVSVITLSIRHCEPHFAEGEWGAAISL
jgi:hypothetical protein